MPASFYAILLMTGIAFVISVIHFLSSDWQSVLSVLESGFCISQVPYMENFWQGKILANHTGKSYWQGNIW